jgi:hypothetical protein
MEGQMGLLEKMAPNCFFFLLYGNSDKSGRLTGFGAFYWNFT